MAAVGTLPPLTTLPNSINLYAGVTRIFALRQIVNKWFKLIFKIRKNIDPSVEYVDPVLGELRNDPLSVGGFLTCVPFEDRRIEFSIHPDVETVEDCLETARALLKVLPEINKKALSVASRNLLDEYNEDWRMFAISHSHGTTEDIENPALTPSEFEEAIRLTNVSVTGTALTLCYSEINLFAGHSIFVEAFDGLMFTDTHASIFG